MVFGLLLRILKSTKFERKSFRVKSKSVEYEEPSNKVLRTTKPSSFGYVFGYICTKQFKLESLIMAQNERWRQA